MVLTFIFSVKIITFELRWLHTIQYQHIILSAIYDSEDCFTTGTTSSLELTSVFHELKPPVWTKGLGTVLGYHFHLFWNDPRRQRGHSLHSTNDKFGAETKGTSYQLSGWDLTRDKSTCGKAGPFPSLSQIKPLEPETEKEQKKPAMTSSNSLVQNTEAWECLKCLQQIVFLNIAGFY